MVNQPKQTSFIAEGVQPTQLCLKDLFWDEKKQNILAVPKKDENKDHIVVTEDMIVDIVEFVHESNGHAGWDGRMSILHTTIFYDQMLHFCLRDARSASIILLNAPRAPKPRRPILDPLRTNSRTSYIPANYNLITLPGTHHARVSGKLIEITERRDDAALGHVYKNSQDYGSLISSVSLQCYSLHR
jgi:hypothetical protein